MSKTKVKNSERELKKVYGFFDEVLGEFVQIVMLSDDSLSPYLDNFANDVSNPYYRKMSDLFVYQLGEIDLVTGELSNEGRNTYFACMNQFVDEKIRNLQIITQTLNFLPNGYFKMPKEMQESIQQRMQECIIQYVENYADKDDMQIMVDKLGENHDN